LGIEKVEFPDDSLWIDRHHRGNLLEHYKDLLSLFVAHGIFFENYNMSDPHEVAFVKEILRPACEEVKRRFGYYPLISPIFPMHFETFDFWISYTLRCNTISLCSALGLVSFLLSCLWYVPQLQLQLVTT
jgi:hypothetical protein